jgi:hypothetical protein
MCRQIGETYRSLWYPEVSFARFKTQLNYSKKARSYGALMASFGLTARRTCGQTQRLGSLQGRAVVDDKLREADRLERG